jgi:hypothetical protein
MVGIGMRNRVRAAFSASWDGRNEEGGNQYGKESWEILLGSVLDFASSLINPIQLLLPACAPFPGTLLRINADQQSLHENLGQFPNPGIQNCATLMAINTPSHPWPNKLAIRTVCWPRKIRQIKSKRRELES